MSKNIIKFAPLIKDLYQTAKKKLDFKPDVSISLINNEANSVNPLGKTAYYDPSNFKIGIYVDGRHIKDILRSFSHELVHHAQNCRGDFDNGAATIQGYAQEDGYLREMEREAYEYGNMIFRDWEDNLKKKDGKPLFTSTSYTPPHGLDIVTGGFFMEGEKLMENKLKESRLHDIIRGVIQEMFNDDLSEENAEGRVVSGEERRGVEESKKELDEDTEELEEKVRKDSPDRKKGNDPKDRLKPLEEVDEENLDEEKEELAEEKEEIDEEKEELAEEKEEIDEVFFPKNRSIRHKARVDLNEALMKRWSKLIK